MRAISPGTAVTESEGMAVVQMTHVEGTNGHDVKLYALSTCGWCRKTKALLTLSAADIRPVGDDDLLAVRQTTRRGAA